MSGLGETTAVPPGRCLTHGPFVGAVCPGCSTAAPSTWVSADPSGSAPVSGLGGTQPGGEQAREALDVRLRRLASHADLYPQEVVFLNECADALAALAAAEARADAADRLAGVAEDYLRDEYPMGTSHPADKEAARLERAVAKYRALAGSPVGPPPAPAAPDPPENQRAAGKPPAAPAERTKP